jgi:hypothetical protein
VRWLVVTMKLRCWSLLEISMTSWPRAVPTIVTGPIKRRAAVPIPGACAGSRLLPTVRDLLAIGRALPIVELGRLRQGPGPLLKSLRLRGSRRPERTPQDRARLRRIIAAVDASFPGGGNCYRRALLEISLDPAAAREPLRLGLRPEGGSRSGHAWLDSSGEPGGRYEVELSV